MTLKRHFITILAVTTLTLIHGQRPVTTIDIGSTSYLISASSPFTPNLNWFLAYQYCRNHGMELLTLSDSTQTQLLNRYLETNVKYKHDVFWTSGNTLGSEDWFWMTTGQPFNESFNHWISGSSPLTKADTLCMITKGGKWDTANCYESNNFICQLTRCYLYNYNRVRGDFNHVPTPAENSNVSATSEFLNKKKMTERVSGSIFSEEQPIESQVTG